MYTLTNQEKTKTFVYREGMDVHDLCKELGREVPEPGSQDGIFFECFFCGVTETQTRTLKRCSGCQLVVYCSKDCQEDDWRAHKPICKKFPVVNGKNVYHATGPWEKHIAGLREQGAQLPKPHDFTAKRIFSQPKVCKTCHKSQPDRLKVCKCNINCYCSEACARKDKSHRISCRHHCKMMKEAYIDAMRISYPASFMNFLEQMMKAGDRFKIMDIGIMDIHVVTSTAYVDAGAWELLFHKLPNLEMIELTFILQDIPYDASLNRFRFQLPRLGCRDCDSRERVVQYSVYQKPYHMYFSSTQYMQPDFVVTYGIPHQKDNVHNEISYRNMTNYSGSILVMMDATKDLLIKAVEDVKAAQPSSVVLLSPERNRSRGFGANVSEMNFNADAPNVKHYMAALHRPSGDHEYSTFPNMIKETFLEAEFTGAVNLK